MRGSPKKARTGCWRWNGLIGQPYAGFAVALAAAWPGATNVMQTSVAAAVTVAAIACLRLARSVSCACVVAMPPRSDPAQTSRPRPAHGPPTVGTRPSRGRGPRTRRRGAGVLQPARVYDFRILGPLEVTSESGPIALGGPRQRALLAALLLRVGRVVPTDQLVDELYGAEPPKTAIASLQNSVAALRKALGPDVLVTRSPGYVLTLVTRADRRASLRADARRRESRIRRGAPHAPRARARPLARPAAGRVRLRGVGADRSPAS